MLSVSILSKRLCIGSSPLCIIISDGMFECKTAPLHFRNVLSEIIVFLLSIGLVASSKPFNGMLEDW